MQIILLERVEKLGIIGDVVDVKSGYARNYLLPQGKALRANKVNFEAFEARRLQIEADNLVQRETAQSVAEEVRDMHLSIIRQASDTGILYGSVNSRDISDKVTEDGVSVNRSQVILDRPIKTLGIHDVRIRLHPEVSVMVKVNVAKSKDEAHSQLRKAGLIAEPVSDAETGSENELGLGDEIEAQLSEANKQTYSGSNKQDS